MAITKGRSAHLVFIVGVLLLSIYTMWGSASVLRFTNLRVDVCVFGADILWHYGLNDPSSYEAGLNPFMC